MQEGSMGREISGFKKTKKHQAIAEADPGIREAQAQIDAAKPVDFSDKEVTKVYKKSEALDQDVVGVMEGLDKAGAMSEVKNKKMTKSNTEKKPAVIVMSPEEHGEAGAKRRNIKIEQGIENVLQSAEDEEEEMASLKDIRKSFVKKSAKEEVEDEVEEVADLKKIRQSISKKPSNYNKGASKERNELLPQLMAEKAQAAYAQAYTRYDSKLTAKLSYDMIAATHPPRLAFLTAKGRELNRLYKEMREKVQAAGQGEGEE